MDSGKSTVLNMSLQTLSKNGNSVFIRLTGIVETLLIDLSKSYDCGNHDLIIAKLESYGVGENSLRLVKNSPKNKTKAKR